MMHAGRIPKRIVSHNSKWWTKNDLTNSPSPRWPKRLHWLATSIPQNWWNRAGRPPNCGCFSCTLTDVFATKRLGTPHLQSYRAVPQASTSSGSTFECRDCKNRNPLGRLDVGSLCLSGRTVFPKHNLRVVNWILKPFLFCTCINLVIDIIFWFCLW